MRDKNIKMVGLCGFPGSGKSTAAWTMAHLKPGEFTRYAIEDELRSQCISMMQAVDVHINFWRPRGVDVMNPVLKGWYDQRENMSKGYWINSLMDEIKRDKERGLSTLPIIVDVRKADEAQAIVNHGGVLIKINRPNFGDNNQEEKMNMYFLDNKFPDIQVVNNAGTKEELGWRVLGCLERRISKDTK